jgi:hypothetical protein
VYIRLLCLVLSPDCKKDKNSCSSKTFSCWGKFHIHPLFSVVFSKCLAEIFSFNACNIVYGYWFFLSLTGSNN